MTDFDVIVIGSAPPALHLRRTHEQPGGSQAVSDLFVPIEGDFE
jgi:hypothetical protein